MDTSPKISVMVIENDDDFRSLLSGIFARSEKFALVNSFSSIDDFADAMRQQNTPQSWLPQLLVADIMSGKDPRIECTGLILALRNEGLNFATLFITSMNFGSLIRILQKSHPKGWAILQKNSKLTESAILETAVLASSEMSEVR